MLSPLLRNDNPKLTKHMFNIEEQILSTSEDKLLLETLSSDNELFNFPFVWTAYINTNTSIPIFIQPLNGCNTKGRDSCFKKELKQINPLDYSLLLYLCTFYPLGFGLEFLREKLTQNKNSSFLDTWLGTTWGLILYSFQLEHIYSMLTGSDAQKAVDFKKNWNKKIVTTRAKTNHLELYPGYSLAMMLHDLTLEENQFVFTPNLNGAYNLCKYLNRA